MRVLCISGKRFAGKDTLARLLVEAAARKAITLSTYAFAGESKRMFAAARPDIDLARLLDDRVYKEIWLPQLTQFTVESLATDPLIFVREVMRRIEEPAVITDLRLRLEVAHLRAVCEPQVVRITRSDEHRAASGWTFDAAKDLAIPGGERELDRFARRREIERVGKQPTHDETDVAASCRWAIGATGERREAAGTDAEVLRAAGFTVIREKVEALSSSPGVPRDLSEAASSPADRYFEFHLLIDGKHGPLSEDDMLALRGLSTEFAARFSRPVPLSYNALKPAQRFLNLRARGCGVGEAMQPVEQLSAAIAARDLVVKKTIAEYICFDSNREVDNGWLEP